MNERTINLNQIHEGYSPRKDFTGQEELKGSIEKDKLLEPILVRKDREKYIVIDGIMRLRVVKELGFNEIDCIIKEVDEKTAAHLSYRMNSNDCRRNLNPIEVSLHIKEMRETFGYKIKDLIKLGYGKDPKTIYNKLNLLTLPETVQTHIAEGTLKPTAGYHLTKLNSKKQQIQIAEETTAKVEISTGKVGKKVNAILSAEKRQNQDMELIPEIPQGEIPGVFIKDASDMSELKDESVCLIVTSPGYFVGMEYEENMTFEEHLENLHKVFSECNRVLKPGGRICINFVDIHTFGTRNGGKPEMKLMGHEYQKILGEHGIRLTDEIIWRKGLNWINNPQCSYHDKSKHAEWRMLRNTEKIYIFRKDGDREVPFDLEYDSKISQEEHKEWVDSVWNIEPVTKQEKHPAQFPEEIPRRLIKMFSFKDDMVLDPFGGIMTTVKVANELGRVGIGYERDAKYKSAIMEKLGIKEEDLKQPDTNVPQREDKKNESDFVDRFEKSVTKILATENRGKEDIRSIKVPYKSNFSKEEIVIDCAPDPEEPDPSGSPNVPAVVKADDYENKKHHPLITLLERKSDNESFLNTVIRGDCFDTCKELATESVDLVITSPPYANTKNYGTSVKVYHPDEYVDWILPLFKEIHRILKPTGSLILNINDRIVNKKRHPYVHELICRAVRETRLKIYDEYSWVKKTALPNGNGKRCNNITEYLLHFCKDENRVKVNMDAVREPYDSNTVKRCEYPVGSFKLEVDESGRPLTRSTKKIQLNEKGKIPSNVFHFPTASAVRGKKHPAAFHIDLPTWFIRALTNEGDIVLDTFAGTGTSCLAAKRLNRKYIGIELSPVYHEIATQKIETAAFKKAA
jgi:ParB/RepB/Spo0J family partition protein